MIRTLALTALSLILASCATRSLPAPPPVDQPKPMAPDPRLCAPVTPTPKPPDGASIVKPTTPAESLATGLHLGWVAELVDVATENEGRAVLARKEACER